MELDTKPKDSLTQAQAFKRQPTLTSAIDPKELTDDEKIDLAAQRIIKLYRPAFEELAK